MDKTLKQIILLLKVYRRNMDCSFIDFYHGSSIEDDIEHLEINQFNELVAIGFVERTNEGGPYERISLTEKGFNLLNTFQKEYKNANV